MKKTKILAAVSALTMCIGAGSGLFGISADAISPTIMTPCIPESYEEIDDHGFFAMAASESNTYTVPYLVWESEDDWLVVKSPHFNWIWVTVTDETLFDEIYAEYSEVLDFDLEDFADDCNQIQLYDYLDADGNVSFDVNDFEDKSSVIQEFCRELYDAGAISSANFVYAQVYAKVITEVSIAIEGLTEEDAEAITALSSDATVMYDNGELMEGRYNVYFGEEELGLTYYVRDVGTFEETYTLAETLAEEFPDAEVSLVRNGWEESALKTYSTGMIDILTEDISVITSLYGDMDGDEEVTVQDAYTCMCAFAEVSAGNDDGLTDSQRTATDVDGDGEITMQDAYLIQMYAANFAAGKDVTWENILELQNQG
ncbi:MAG: dockerin type I repeat-containing protein [Ruminococcus sp.]|nr:dockerin type I repeat-containing protein [Ruminococcus sp.]